MMSETPIRDLIRMALDLQAEKDYDNAQIEKIYEAEITALENRLDTDYDRGHCDGYRKGSKATEQEIRDAMMWMAKGILQRLRRKGSFDIEELCNQYLAERGKHD